jgi:hypothetical protein
MLGRLEADAEEVEEDLDDREGGDGEDHAHQAAYLAAGDDD